MATVTIQKRKPKNSKSKISYRVQYKDPLTFQTKYYRTFYKYGDALKCKARLANLIDDNRFAEINTRRRRIQPLKFSELGELLVKDWRNRVHRDELSQASFRDYTLRLNVLNRRLGKRLVTELSIKDIADYHQQVFDRFSPASANRYLFIIKQVFKKALSEGATAGDPAADIKYFSERQHERNKFLMPEDLVTLVAASQKIRAKHYMPALIYLGAEHGASRQEALSLHWTDIKFDAEEIGMIRLYRAKNGVERTEFLMPRTKEALFSWKAHLERRREQKHLKVNDGRFVFCRLNGKPIERFDTAWRRICEEAGFKGFHYHDLRHTFCSNLIMSGSDLKETREMIGHKDISMTDRYTHLNAMHKKALQERLAARYSKI